MCVRALGVTCIHSRRHVERMTEPCRGMDLNSLELL